MLPFLNSKKIVSVIAARKGKPGVEVSPEVEGPGEGIDAGLKEAATDLLSAIERKSVIDLAKALQAAFEICGDMPEDESPVMGEGEEV
jgi:alcohol dehydrogenase YqhD (iron-dependent ADH family)